MDT
ncbi:hypothetical protein LCER1_G008198, partial [Lachnellula cervina]|jgi:hypothetical protein